VLLWHAGCFLFAALPQVRAKLVIAHHGQPLHNAGSKAPPVASGHSADEPNWAAVIVAGMLILFLIGSCT